MSSDPGPDGRPILIFFGSSTSGPSRRMEAFVDQVLQARRNHQTFRRRKVDIDDQPDLAERFDIRRAPTIVVVDGDRVARRIEGRVGVDALRAELADWLR
jgi:thioredoxin-like negative regulator of GroEL